MVQPEYYSEIAGRCKHEAKRNIYIRVCWDILGLFYGLELEANWQSHLHFLFTSPPNTKKSSVYSWGLLITYILLRSIIKSSFTELSSVAFGEVGGQEFKFVVHNLLLYMTCHFKMVPNGCVVHPFGPMVIQSPAIFPWASSGPPLHSIE